MNVSGKIVVVTGGGSGIGEALCKRFHQAGARKLVVVDLARSEAERVASEISGLGFQCDVSKEAALVDVIEKVEAELGPIALFCSNAGIGIPDPDTNDPTSAFNDIWNRNWGVHVMAHVYAARNLGPKMAARGGGYFLNTVSAAGLLTQIGNAPYSTTKHAAVGFAESLAIAYRDKNVRVSILCPQGVATPMVKDAMNTPAVADGIISAEDVAETVMAGLAAEQFLILPHPRVLDYMQRKSKDYDRWLRRLSDLHQQSLPKPSA